MKNHKAFVDEVALAREFATGDWVRKTTNRDIFYSPYVGRVLYSDDQTGNVMVQWPWGAEGEQPSGLIRDASGDFLPPLILDQLYSTVERDQHTNSDEDFKLSEKYRKSLGSTISQRVAEKHSRIQRIKKIAFQYEKVTLPVKKAVCLAFHKGVSEVEAYRIVSDRWASQFGTEPVRLTVSNFYEASRRIAIYWKDTNRTYRVTQKEKTSGKLKCPRCSSQLKPRTYRQGKKVMACKDCGFSISPKDLIASNFLMGIIK